MSEKFTRAELVERLRKLEKSQTPQDLAEGAMCYMRMPWRAEKKPCPECGKMMIVGQMDNVLRRYNVPLKRIQNLGLDVKLVLPEHCPKCGYGVGPCGMGEDYLWYSAWDNEVDREDLTARQLRLEIHYSDMPEPVLVLLKKPHDLEILALFLQGKDRYTDDQERETPLKKWLGRLGELLGMEEEKEQQPGT